jgi:quinol monooxygenase YgiN
MVATITADPRHVAAVEDALLAAVPAVRNEDGCRQYELIDTATRLIASR